MITSQGTNRAPSTLLVADDEIEIGEIIQAIAEDLGFQVTCVHEGLKVVDLVERIKPDVIALDLRMPGADGVEIIRELGNRKCAANIILMSGMDQRTLSSVQALGREHALEIGTTLTKPMSVDAIEGALRPLLSCVAKVPEPNNTPHNATFNYGMAINFEPELSLKPMHAAIHKRVRVVPSWHLDNGDVLSGTPLSEWVAREGIGKGISKMMFATALETLRVWGNQNFTPSMSLKLDPALFLELGIPDILANIVDSFVVPRELITLEIDEAVITANQNNIVDVLSRLRIKGFQLSVNVAGEGDAILPTIDTLPIDNVIIDMDYMSRKPDFLQNMETEFLYSSLTSVANHKGISTCATNVNTADILTFVQRCNFNSARGVQLFAPVSGDEILPLYADAEFSNKPITN